MIRTTSLWLAALALAAPLLAHHPFSADFDATKPLSLTGRIQNVTWSEPHVTITLNVANQTYQGDWKLEAASPATLQRQGLTQSMLKEGGSVTVNTYRALDGSRMLSVREIRLPDNRWYSLSDPAEDRGPAPTNVSSSNTTTSSTQVAANQAPAGQGVNDELPQTAGYIPWFAVGGVASLIFAATLSRMRSSEY
jgi:hypothetical protein